MVLAKNKINFLLSFSHTTKTICAIRVESVPRLTIRSRDSGKVPSNSQKFTHFPHQKNLHYQIYILLKTLWMEEEPHLAAIQLFFSHTRKFPSPNSSFHVTTQLKLHSQLQSLELYHFFSFRLYMYTCHVLIN